MNAATELHHEAQLPQLWHEVESLIRALGGMIAAGEAADIFFAQLLQASAALLEAPAACVWLARADNQFAMQWRYTLESAAPWPLDVWRSQHQAILADAHKLDAPRFVDATRPVEFPATLRSPHPWCVAICPVRQAGRLEAVLEFVLPPTAGPRVRSGYAQFLTVLADLTRDCLAASELRQLRGEAQRWRDRMLLSERLHASLDSHQIAYHLANEGRVQLGVDRVCVALCDDRRCRVVAVSGADHVERHNSSVPLLEQLTSMVARSQQPVVYAGSPTDDLAPELEVLVHDYTDLTHVTSLSVVPLLTANQSLADGQQEDHPELRTTVGVLVAESFTTTRQPPPTDTWGPWLTAAATALGNAARYESIPFRGFWQRWQQRSWRRHHWLWLGIGSLLAILLLLVVPADLQITAPGELQPLDRRHVYARTDGVVEAVHVRHGDTVEVGQLLATVRNAELDAELESLHTELEAAQAQLDAVTTTLLEGGPAKPATTIDLHEHSARKRALQHQVASLESQLSLLQRERTALHIRSPLAGQVITWEPEQRLLDRPVVHGDTLLTVADPQGPWVVELHVPSGRSGHVIAADDGPQSLPVQFMLTANPGRTYDATVTRLSVSAEYDEDLGSTVRVTARVTGETVSEPMPGAEVRAKIHCGRRCLGFVWFHGVIDAVRTWLLW